MQYSMVASLQIGVAAIGLRRETAPVWCLNQREFNGVADFHRAAQCGHIEGNPV